MEATVLRGIGGFYYAMDDGGYVHTLRAQAKIRREHLKPKIGDRVDIEAGSGEDYGWIRSVLPRRNELTRPPVANIDRVVIVLSCAAPEPDLAMADRLLTNARRAHIAPMIVITKCDLDADHAEAIQRQYAKAEAEVMGVCAHSGEGLEALRRALAGTVHALAGQSGAGKSTLINALYGLDLETGDLSRRIDRGKNTTRRCELIPVAGGGMVLDTPGFSLLETELFDPVELKESYPEFSPYEGQCYFKPCYHGNEPRCAVHEAVKAGQIDEARYKRYTEALEEQKIKWRDRYA